MSQFLGRVGCLSSASTPLCLWRGSGRSVWVARWVRAALGVLSWASGRLALTSLHPALLISGASVAQNSSFSPSGLQFCPDWPTCMPVMVSSFWAASLLHLSYCLDHVWDLVVMLCVRKVGATRKLSASRHPLAASSQLAVFQSVCSLLDSSLFLLPPFHVWAEGPLCLCRFAEQK